MKLIILLIPITLITAHDHLCTFSCNTEDLRSRSGVHQLHYREHKQSVEEAKRKIASLVDDRQDSFEASNLYSGLGSSVSSRHGIHSSDIDSKGFLSRYDDSRSTGLSSSSLYKSEDYEHKQKHLDDSRLMNVISTSDRFTPIVQKDNRFYGQQYPVIPKYKMEMPARDLPSYVHETHIPISHETEEHMKHIKQDHLRKSLVDVISTPSISRHEFYMKDKNLASMYSPQPHLALPVVPLTPSYHHDGMTSTSQIRPLISDTEYIRGLSSSKSRSDIQSVRHPDSQLFDSQFKRQKQFGRNLAENVKFGSTFDLNDQSSIGLRNYMSEAERLAKEQAETMVTTGTRIGGSQLSANLGDDQILHDFDHLGLTTGGLIGGGDYKSKAWQKASKWSSKSEISDGKVDNYNELSTGESEQYNINGKRSGFKAATATLDDNGKVSSYSLHT